MVERFGGYVLLSRRDLDLVEHFFNKYGSITVLVGRMLPIVRTFIALPAGIARMPRGRFHLYTFLGSWPWCLGLAYLGMKLGETGVISANTSTSSTPSSASCSWRASPILSGVTGRTASALSAERSVSA